MLTDFSSGICLVFWRMRRLRRQWSGLDQKGENWLRVCRVFWGMTEEEDEIWFTGLRGFSVKEEFMWGLQGRFFIIWGHGVERIADVRGAFFLFGFRSASVAERLLARCLRRFRKPLIACFYIARLLGFCDSSFSPFFVRSVCRVDQRETLFGVERCRR